MIRAFIAVDLDPVFKDQIREIQKKFEAFDLKFVNPEIVHITLKFLGDVKESEIPLLASALDSLDCEPFEARIEGIGLFPKPGNPKVLWLGASGDFAVLHDELEKVLRPLKFEEDGRKFLAHATLARVKFLPKSRKTLFLETFQELKNIKLGSMPVEKVVLKKSTLTPEGPIYEALHTKDLK